MQVTLPLIAFVHVPKAAGTTVINVLGALSHRGLHSRRTDATPLHSLGLRDIDWVAGHITRDAFSTFLTWVDRPVEYFSVVRNPKRRLISHLNFSFYRTKLQNYFEVSNLDEQVLDSTVMSTDFKKVDAVKSLLLRNPYTFFNVQSRYILGPDYDRITNDEARSRIAGFRYIANEDTLAQLYHFFGFSFVPKELLYVRSNSSEPFFDATIFDNPDMDRFLHNHLAFDFKLYDLTQQVFRDCPTRSAIRPSYLLEPVTSVSTLDEAAYLRENRDVARAVANGEIESALLHFQRHGKSEGRKQRKEFPVNGYLK